VVATERIIATEDLKDWEHLVPMRYNALDDTWKPADGINRPAMFFKWRINVVRTEE